MRDVGDFLKRVFTAMFLVLYPRRVKSIRGTFDIKINAMFKVLSVSLIADLAGSGYRFCLSRTTHLPGDDAPRCITLLPLKDKPLAREVPAGYDTCYELTNEPRQMAMSFDDAIILVDLSDVVTYA